MQRVIRFIVTVPAVVERFTDNHFGDVLLFFGRWQTFGETLVPKTEVFKNAVDQQWLIDEADNLHLATALRAIQRVNFPDLLDDSRQVFDGIFLCGASVIVRTSTALDVAPIHFRQEL